MVETTSQAFTGPDNWELKLMEQFQARDIGKSDDSDGEEAHVLMIRSYPILLRPHPMSTYVPPRIAFHPPRFHSYPSQSTLIHSPTPPPSQYVGCHPLIAYPILAYPWSSNHPLFISVYHALVHGHSLPSSLRSSKLALRTPATPAVRQRGSGGRTEEAR